MLLLVLETTLNSTGMHLEVRRQLSRCAACRILAGALLSLMVCLAAQLPAQPQTPALQLSKTIILPGVSGKFDHFAFDAVGDRLFAAATGNHSIEVIDLKSGKVEQSIAGLGKPHGLAWVAETGSLFVADGALGELRVYKGTPLALAGKVKLSDDADDMVYDARTHLLYVGHGGSDTAQPGRVAVVDTLHTSLLANLAVATHPEALELDAAGRRVFANIADASEVAVIGADTQKIVAHWKVTKAADNVPLALDSEDGILFVACRTPGTLIALDAATGNELGSLAAAGGVDDLFYDPALRRVYLISGAGEVDAYQVGTAKTLQALGVLKTAAGAKTALFVAAQNLLYVGVPSAPDRSAEIRVYSTVAR